MLSTVHKILMHGAYVIRTNVLLVGMLVEDASESRNENYGNGRFTTNCAKG